MKVESDDTQSPMAEIASRRGRSIASLLVQAQQSQQPQKKYLSFLKDLECLSPFKHREQHKPWSKCKRRPGQTPATPLFRHWINASNEDRRYVALSYTWKASSHEDERHGRYKVQTRDAKTFYSSPVRDSIFDRVLNYMATSDCELLWIDRHCIPQPNCRRRPCNHVKCQKKHIGLQTMDLVYTLSKYPVALLARPVESDAELGLLASILTGELVDEDITRRRFRSSKGERVCEIKGALKLVREITTDLWWTRAWTFQENYRAKHNMVLLIPHASRLENSKRSYIKPDFGKVRNELSLKSVDFAAQATMLCLAIKRNLPGLAHSESKSIERILRTVGKYTILLKKSCSMSPTIITDIGRRNLKKPWDRIAITANCCQYPIRMDINQLFKEKQSLSVSTLAMCLLNGEILYNGRHRRAQHSKEIHMTITKYIKARFFKRFRCPTSEKNCLTFNKGCRLVNVKLEESGILAEGHLWHLGEFIHTNEFSNQLPWIEHLRGRLSLYQRKRLAQLAQVLRSRCHNPLADCVEDYLDRDSLHTSSNFAPSNTFSKYYMHKMAVELVDAINKGKPLRLGRLWGRTSYNAIFIYEDGDTKARDSSARRGGNRTQKSQSTLAFTASRPKEPGCEDYDPNDIDRHVSLEVDVEHEGYDTDDIPRLYVKRWLLGLCFFRGQKRNKVIFPWPASLQTVVRDNTPDGFERRIPI